MSQIINDRLKPMLICLTTSFIVVQLVFFTIHYQVSELFDILVNTSIGESLLKPIIFLPILQFIIIQLLAYLFFVGCILFLSDAIAELCHLSARLHYCLGIFLWFSGCSAILLLNAYYFPHSFFTRIFEHHFFIEYLRIILMVVTGILILATILAYFNFIYYKRFHFWGIILLLFMMIVIIATFYKSIQIRSVKNAVVFSQPNIIIIGLDSIRPDFTSFSGNTQVKTPNIDHFLFTATTFTNAYTPLARTFPAWMSILTGRHPKRLGVRNNLSDPTMLVLQVTLAKRLQQAGYETIYASDEKRYSNILPDYGFDRIIGPDMGVNDFLMGGLSDFPLSNLLLLIPGSDALFPYHYANRAANITYRPEHFLQLLQAKLPLNVDKPLFLAIHLCLAHWPYTWADDQTADEFLAVRYRSSVEALDQQFGRLIEFLEHTGLLQHSLVILLSDHGTTLGLPNDRIIKLNTYKGDPSKIKLISINKFSTAPEYSLDFKRDYSLNTSYGQGTDVLSLKQYHVLQAFKGYGVFIPNQQIHDVSSLMDIAPTVLDYLALSPLPKTDGYTLTTYFSKTPRKQSSRAIFIETGDKISEIETDHVQVNQVVKQKAKIYKINAHGLLSINKEDEKNIIKVKQRAVLLMDWLLAYYPPMEQPRLPIKTVHNTPPYFVLVNTRTDEWTIGLTSPLAKKAPLIRLLEEFKKFYGDEIPEGHFS